METKRFIRRSVLSLLAGEVIFVAVMCGVFALLERFDGRVLLGGLIGAALAVGNYFLLAVSADRAADQATAQDVKGGKATVRGSYVLRLAVLFVLLAVFIKSGLCNALALLLPLAAANPVLMLTEYFRKSGDKQK